MLRNQPPPPGPSAVKQRLPILLISVAAVVGLVFWDALARLGLAGWLLRGLIVAWLSILGAWLFGLVLRHFLWRVSRRLAFSYFLIGVVPIPLVAAMVLVMAYTLGGYFVGHLYHDAWGEFEGELRDATRHRLLAPDADGPSNEGQIFAFYEDGRRVGGDVRLPESWQDWWPSEPPEREVGFGDENLPVALGSDGTFYVLSTTVTGRRGVVGVWRGDLENEMARRTGLWVELISPEVVGRGLGDTVTFFGREISLRSLGTGASEEEIGQFVHPGVEDPGWLDRPSLVWVEIQRPLYGLGGESVTVGQLYVHLTTNVRYLFDRLLSHSAEIDYNALVVLAVTAFVLFDIYVVAALMALLMIYGLSRAVNRLTDATERMRSGDFASRIVIERRDQIGALQESFNAMADNLETLIADAAQKEILEKDLSIARELQQSLLPDALQAPSALRFAAHFEPSSAIGGDYYDFLPMAENALGVVVADVSGHGLSAGLRMTMVKSALQLLAEQEQGPEEMLRQLHRLLSEGLQRANRRGFVTATLSRIDPSGRLEIHNAGHPPTYLLSGGEVEEILLPSPPLGALGGDFAHTSRQLEPGDVVVWLSDGLVEATDGHDDDFGYQRVVETLRGSDGDPAAVRDQLLAAVEEHTGNRPPADDRTLVVMAYRPD